MINIGIKVASFFTILSTNNKSKLNKACKKLEKNQVTYHICFIDSQHCIQVKKNLTCDALYAVIDI